MELERARQLAIVEFARRLGSTWNKAWEVGGVRQASVVTPDGAKTQLVVDFLRRDLPNSGRLRRVSLAVDPETGTVDMLR
ncbi:hypothetical protein [Micromonospora sp. NBC_00617]|uniref:hypothetical protein n=1 Tax=Micromonospora sp. NBC_00617 TaxID=2903587 RepID=UPI0030E5D6A9